MLFMIYFYSAFILLKDFLPILYDADTCFSGLDILLCLHIIM
jgi:hypothetical protein